MRIGKLADSLGLNPKTIRYYESIGLLPEPDRTPSGYRDYGQEDADRLAFIKTAQRLGLSLDEIAEVIAFRDRSERPCGHVLGLLRAPGRRPGPPYRGDVPHARRADAPGG